MSGNVGCHETVMFLLLSFIESLPGTAQPVSKRQI